MKLNYQEIELLSLNVAGWNWTTNNQKWGDRLRRICIYIKEQISNPLVIALQEVQLSGGKSLSVLKEEFEKNYHIILPSGFKDQPKSIVTLLLLNKKMCKSYNILTLGGLEDSLRYNFATVDTHIGTFKLLNAHIPQNCVSEKSSKQYKQDRQTLREKFCTQITEIANDYRDLIVMGDFNALPDSGFIKSLAYNSNSPMIDAVEPPFSNTWKNRTWKNRRLDYIFYSSGMLSGTGVTAEPTSTDYTTIHSKLSDHALLIGKLRFEV